MNKLILLNEVKKEKIRRDSNLFTLNKSKNENENDDSKNSYITFKEKFDYFKNRETMVNLNNEKTKNINSEKNLNKILKRLFSLRNNLLLINFINSIYNDDLNVYTRFKYIENKDIDNGDIIILKDSSYNLKIIAENEYKKIEYKIQFQTKDDQNIGIMISKTDLSEENNIVSFSKKRKEFQNNDKLGNNSNEYLVIFNSNIEVPDNVYEFEIGSNEQDIKCKINIMKIWKYDFKQLFEKDMYLLFPIKVIDFVKILQNINREFISKELVKDEITRFFKDMNRYLNKVKNNNLITDEDITELNIISAELLNHFIRDEDNILVDIKRDIEATLRDIVV